MSKSRGRIGDYGGDFDLSGSGSFSSQASRYGIAVAVLSAVAIIGAGVQIYRYKKVWPYSYVLAAAFVYLIFGAIQGSLDNSFSGYEEKVIASEFFSIIFAPIVWLLLFDTFRVIAPKDQPGKKIYKVTLNTSLAGTYFAYVWGAIIIIAAVGYAGTIGSVYSGTYSYDTLRNIVHTGEFVNHGLWAFLAPLFAQLYFSYKQVRPIAITFGVYTFLVFLVTVGRSVNASEGNLTATFVLAELFGIFALYVVIAIGHTWKHTPTEGDNTEEYQIGEPPQSGTSKHEV